MKKSYCYRILLVTVFSLFPVFSWAMFTMTDYFPLPEGRTWTYRQTQDNTQITSRVLGTEVVNGTTTIRFDNGGTGMFAGIFSYTNDARGLRLHQVEPNFLSAQVVFDPPILLANAQANVGETQAVMGVANIIVPSIVSSLPITYINHDDCGKRASQCSIRDVRHDTIQIYPSVNGNGKRRPT